MPDDLLTSPIEPAGNRGGSGLDGERRGRKPRSALEKKAEGEQNEPLEAPEAIGAEEPHELDEMA